MGKRGCKYWSILHVPSKQAHTWPKQPRNAQIMINLSKSVITRLFLGQFLRSWALFAWGRAWMAGTCKCRHDYCNKGCWDLTDTNGNSIKNCLHFFHFSLFYDHYNYHSFFPSPTVSYIRLHISHHPYSIECLCDSLQGSCPDADASAEMSRKKEK